MRRRMPTMADPAQAHRSEAGRFWVLFDGSPGSQAALLQALPLVQARGGELCVLYIEDAALARCAGLSINREIGAVSGRLRVQGPLGHRHASTVRRRRAQGLLEHLLGPQAQTLKFESRSGAPLSVLAALVDQTDTLVSGRSGYAGRRPTRLGSLTRALLDAPRSSLMIGSPSGRTHSGPWLLLLDEPASAEQRIGQALDLLGPTGSELRVVCPSDSESSLRPAPIPWVRQRISSELALQKLIQDHHAAGLITTAASALTRIGLAAGWLDRIDRPLLVLNQPPS